MNDLQYYIICRIISDENECWNWRLKSHHTFGYGRAFWKGKSYEAHRLSWIAFNGTIEKGLVVCHCCDNSNCCNPIHLRLDTQKGNVKDMMKLKRHQFGSNHNKAKLNEEQVIKILELRKNGIMNHKIAKIFNVSVSTIERIVYGKGWCHVK